MPRHKEENRFSFNQDHESSIFEKPHTSCRTKEAKKIVNFLEKNHPLISRILWNLNASKAAYCEIELRDAKKIPIFEYLIDTFEKLEKASLEPDVNASKREKNETMLEKIEETKTINLKDVFEKFKQLRLPNNYHFSHLLENFKIFKTSFKGTCPKTR